MSRHELPLPCNHAMSTWRFRVSSHRDDEDIDSRAHCSVWTCSRPECIDRAKSFVAYYARCAPLVIDGETRQVVFA